jgi:hypothetical protein
MFLSTPLGFRKRAERSSCRPLGANCPHGSPRVFLREHGTSFRPGRGYSGDAAIPEAASPWGETRTAAWPDHFAVLMGPVDPARAGTAWDFHRSVWSAIVPRRGHQSPCRSAAPTRRTGREGKRANPLPRGFGRLGSVAYRPGRNVTPPELLLPGPSVGVRCRPPLAA